MDEKEKVDALKEELLGAVADMAEFSSVLFLEYRKKGLSVLEAATLTASILTSSSQPQPPQPMFKMPEI